MERREDRINKWINEDIKTQAVRRAAALCTEWLPHADKSRPQTKKTLLLLQPLPRQRENLMKTLLPSAVTTATPCHRPVNYITRCVLDVLAKFFSGGRFSFLRRWAEFQQLFATAKITQLWSFPKVLTNQLRGHKTIGWTIMKHESMVLILLAAQFFCCHVSAVHVG